ncbi:LysR family transcriptional regulator [Grimontia hollisae]|uniref:Putative transcriptional regulator LysR family protein n=1 Tax=Grimontia hollisae CIP 101886 TaxID=675812 RepID=D0ICR0_GRIHO|nr:LysR family transcriptional regulator [Grimontia hollisae]AUW37799.1 LysR family transcriptional regulator [Grimontia hollisae]EEY71678.1 putative transcriptional regulator LysR family protein [Grimontia hollisae CIP 101886]STO42799.1 Gcv operon activator [Grimontia hollisae]
MAMAIPPMKTLRTFTVVAQTLSFSKAAKLLNLTQSAISKQIQHLEELMGCALFERAGGKVELTEAGRRYLPSVVEALENLQHATSTVMQTSETKSRIEISVPPSLASLWLIPRLDAFRCAHPNIELAVRASVTSDSHNRYQGDIAIHCLPLSTHEEDAELLVRERLMLVASPPVVEGLSGIEGLLPLPAISHITRPQIWNQFWHELGVAPNSPTYGTGVEHFYMALEAVKYQQGMALIPQFMVQDTLQRGEVTNPLSLGFSSLYGYFLFSHGYKRRLGPVKQVIDWLKREMVPPSFRCESMDILRPSEYKPQSTTETGKQSKQL